MVVIKEAMLCNSCDYVGHPSTEGGLRKIGESGIRITPPRCEMSRRYDHKTTTFSPEGRLYQVEYAMEAINHAGACVGVLAQDGVFMVCEKKVSSKLLDHEKEAEKLYRIDDHVSCAIAGITSDANILIDKARLVAQRFFYTYNEPIPVENLVRSLCDVKQGYTQFGGMRPFGVSFIYAGWDEHFNFQLYKSDPSGNFGGWKAIAIGSNHQASNSILKTDWKEDLTLQDAGDLCVKVMSKTMDSTTLTFEKLELATLTLVEGQLTYRVFSEAEVNAFVEAATERLKAKEDEESDD